MPGDRNLFKTFGISHSDGPRSFIKQVCLRVVILHFMQLTKSTKKSDHEILYLTFYYMYELSHVNEYCSNPF